MDEKKYQFIVTDLAVEQIKKQLLKRGTPQAYLRCGVKGGGCSGYSYVIQFEDKDPQTKDLIFIEGNVSIIIDNKSILYLNGCTLDWEKTLMHQGFKFLNPQEKSSCGCGSSFQV